MRLRLLCTLVLFLPATVIWAQTGKIAGVVTDAALGDPLPGVNVVIEGTTQGSVTDVEGYYSILNLRPGTYDVRASFIGFTPEVASGVRVNIDQTTELNFALGEETVGLDELVVSAERPVVQRDVSASVANLSATEIENIPVVDVDKVVGLQAGFERGLTVRGSGGNQVSFLVDGLNTASGIGNTPFTGISYTAVDEVQVQTGGFNAEYGNVRSGLINVVTKDPSRDRYTADVIVRYGPPTQRAFGLLANDDGAYFMRPYVDPDVAFVGTSAAWEGDTWLQDQYPSFVGWNSLARDRLGEGATDQQIGTLAQQMMDAYRWYTRKDFEIDSPDYEIDGTIGGPVPGISPYLGNLRFLASYRQTQDPFIVPMIRENYKERTIQGKLTSDVAQGMKLVLQGLWGRQEGINDNEQGWQNMWTGDLPYYPWDGGAYLANDLNGDQIFANNYRNPMDVTNFLLGGQFTHTLNATTFYEVQIQRMGTTYKTFTTAERDPTVINTIGPFQLTEEPFGWEWRDSYDQVGVGRRNGGHWFSARDSSDISRWNFKFDLTSQLNRYSTVKAGVEYIYSNYDINFGEVDPAHPHHANPKYVWDRTPQQGAVYAQNKLEFKGMVANVGLRLDYFHAGGEWYVTNPFDRALTAQAGRENLDENLDQQPTERQFALSPRLGVSFPITDNSKLYFNYGHFRQMLNPVNLFTISEINTGAVDLFGNPNEPMPRTVAYELGYEQNIANQFLLRLAGYYRDLSDQPRDVHFTSIDGEVNYTTYFPYNYEDTRGFEVTLTKNRGNWIRGFVNYTYLARKTGNFGFSNIYENRVTMRNYLLTTTDHYQSKPVPEPFARMNLELLTPVDFGPEWGANFSPLGDWRLNLLGEWRQGQTLTWTGQGLISGRSPERGIEGNVNWVDFWNLDLRLAKNFEVSNIGRAQIFMDVTNVLNLKHLTRNFLGNQDDLKYYRSLHLPEDIFEGREGGAPYAYIPGDDKPGTYRNEDVEFVPIVLGDLPEAGHTRPLYYDDGTYYQWNGSAFVQADQGKVKQVLDDKAYIDMPNNTSFSFLNPRRVFFGMRVSF